MKVVDEAATRRYRIYSCSDLDAGGILTPKFEYRLAGALERARREHYGDGGTFHTEENHMPEGQWFYNKDVNPTGWGSPRFVNIGTDDPAADFGAIEGAFRQYAREAAVGVDLVFEGAYELRDRAWSSRVDHTRPRG